MKHFLSGLALDLFVIVMSAWAIPSQGATLDPLIEYRYLNPAAGEVIKRDTKGVIIRRADVIAAFKRIHPCPSTGLYKGACPDYALNHVITLACGGVDAVSNLQWMRNELKSCAASTGRLCVDRYELKINALNPPIPDTANCVNEVVP